MKRALEWLGKRNVLLILLAISLLALAGVGGSWAKYRKSHTQTGVVSVPAFYFCSDLLVEGGKSSTLNPGVTQLEFFLRNYRNGAERSDRTVFYTVSVDNGATLSVDGGAALATVQGKLDGDGSTESEASVRLSQLQGGKTYTVTAVGELRDAQGNVAFTKTLTATVTVLEENIGFYAYLDTTVSAYVELMIKKDGPGGTVRVIFPAGLIPDPVNPHLSGISNYDELSGEYQSWEFEFALPDDGDVTLRFYKDNPTDVYQLSNFTVQLDGVDATPKKPSTP